MSAQDILNAMLNAAPDQVGALASNVEAINQQIVELTAQANAIEEGILEVDATALIIYLNDVKLVEFQVTEPFATLVIGASYNVINISDWEILDASANVIYKYLGVGWDGDAFITELVTDWAFGYDYLTRPLVSGATYGIYPQISSLSDAKSLLETNKAKIEASIDVLGRYV